MTDERLKEARWEPLHVGGEEASLTRNKVREEDTTKISSGRTKNSQDPCPEEQRQSLGQKTPEMNTPGKSCSGGHTDREGMTDGFFQEEGWQTLHEGGVSASLDGIEVREEDAGKFPSEMIQDAEEYCTEEQRQSMYQKILAMSTPDKFRLAIFANREVRNLLIHDPKRMISLAVLRNQRINEKEMLAYAQRKDLSEDVVTAIAKDPKWKKSYPMKLALVANPKTPLSTSINLLPHLQDRDLKSLSRDKDVAPALKQKAQAFLRQRNNGK